MDRRAFLGTLALLSAPLAAEAQQAGKVYRVGWVGIGPLTSFSDPTNLPVRAFRAELRDRGYVEGQNLILEPRSVDGKIERASEVMAELVRLGVDVIVSTGPELTRAAKRVTAGVPIVMLSREPIEEGLVASLARPGGNVTGMTRDTGPDLDSKRLDLLRQGIPTLRRVAYLGLKAEWAAPAGRNLQSAAGASGVTLFLAERGANDYTKAFDLIARKRAQAIMISQTVFHWAHRRLIADFAATHKLPSLAWPGIGSSSRQAR